MELLNVTFLVVEDDTACEDIIVNLPVLENQGIDSRLLLKQKWNAFDDTDCTTLYPLTTGKNVDPVSLKLVARMQPTGNEPL